jgi:hypothetical protein
MSFVSVLGPLIAAIISILFTLWYTNRNKKEKLNRLRGQKYIKEIISWAEKGISLSETTSNGINNLTKRERLSLEGMLLSTIPIPVSALDDELDARLSEAINLLANMPKGKPCTDEQAKDFHDACAKVLDRAKRLALCS